VTITVLVAAVALLMTRMVSRVALVVVAAVRPQVAKLAVQVYLVLVLMVVLVSRVAHTAVAVEAAQEA